MLFANAYYINAGVPVVEVVAAVITPTSKMTSQKGSQTSKGLNRNREAPHIPVENFRRIIVCKGKLSQP